ncbi:MAG: DUF4160 domain-containing protein [Deltaproteobacteria bacterium]|nr:DUF4160 domain-containing protein [Deltaproteobacteria bacterium]
MPQICYFYGIVIMMYYDEHNPPHIHCTYGGYKATFEIQTTKRTTGNMPKTAEKLIKKWIAMSKNELLSVWDLAQKHISPLPTIAPLE